MKFDAAYVHVLGNKPGERINLVKYKEPGYYLCKPGKFDNPSMTADEVNQTVAVLNRGLGMDPDVPMFGEIIESMYLGSMFGWDKPCAARAVHYFEVEGTNGDTIEG